MRRRVILILAFAALAVAACGGGGEDEKAAAADDAEATVRSYLEALLAKRGADACAKFTPEYQRSVVRQNRDFARERGLDDCAGLLDAVTRANPSVTFEGRPLERGTIGRLDFQTSVRASGEGHNATVTGALGIQRYELETRDGRWLIAAIERTG